MRYSTLALLILAFQLVNDGAFSEEKLKGVISETNKALDELEIKLKEARKGADQKSEESLDALEKKVKELSRKLERLGEEKNPDKKKADEIQNEMNQVSKEIEKKKKS